MTSPRLRAFLSAGAAVITLAGCGAKASEHFDPVFYISDVCLSDDAGNGEQRGYGKIVNNAPYDRLWLDMACPASSCGSASKGEDFRASLPAGETYLFMADTGDVTVAASLTSGGDVVRRWKMDVRQCLSAIAQYP